MYGGVLRTKLDALESQLKMRVQRGDERAQWNRARVVELENELEVFYEVGTMEWSASALKAQGKGLSFRAYSNLSGSSEAEMRVDASKTILSESYLPDEIRDEGPTDEGLR